MLWASNAIQLLQCEILDLLLLSYGRPNNSELKLCWLQDLESDAAARVSIASQKDWRNRAATGLSLQQSSVQHLSEAAQCPRVYQLVRKQ